MFGAYYIFHSHTINVIINVVFICEYVSKFVAHDIMYGIYTIIL